MKTSTLLLTPLALTSVLPGANIVHAQTYTPSNRTPVADNTLGTQVSGSSITGGLQRGQTLFHSFTDFSVPTNGQANFLNPAGNRDIISRVTGNLFSDINGTINTQGANFFLINPNGMVFGPNAQLNVGKAFVGSTANSIDLVDGSGRTVTFGTNPNGDAPLLAVNSDVFFNVSRLNLGGGTGAISNFGTLQTNNNSQYIGLIGGQITLDGSAGGGKIVAPGGRVDIGGLTGAGTVTVDNNGLVFGNAGVGRSNVLLTNGAKIIVRAMGTLDTVNTFFNNATAPGSSLNINANNIDIFRSGVTVVPNQPGAIDAGLDLNSVQTKPTGNININATGKVNLNNAGIKNTLRTGSEGIIGDINIQAATLDVKNNSLITSGTSGKGNAGAINIKTTGDIIISGKDIVSKNPTTSDISGISSNTFGQGDAGKITIETQGKLSLLNQGFISSQIGDTGVGNSKGISIMARELELANGSLIYTGISGGGKSNGDAGDINIKTTGDIKISGYDSSLTSPLNISSIDGDTDGQGDSGKITIETQGNLSLLNQGFISSRIGDTGVGNSKGIKITAREIELVNSSRIGTSTSQTDQVDGTGNAGDIDLKSIGNISISKESIINSDSYGKGDTGKINIDNQGKLALDNGSIFSAIGNSGIGNSKGIKINSGALIIANNSIIQSSAFPKTNVTGKGNAGNIDIQTTGDITFSNNTDSINTDSINGIGALSSSSGLAGNISLSTKGNLFLSNSTISAFSGSVSGGNITLNTRDKLLLRNNSFINSASTSRDRNGNGGNIMINSPLIIALPGDNDISADANGGNGGNINITSQGLFGIGYRPKGQESRFTNDITASSTFGQSGNVNISTPGIDPGKDKGELAVTPSDASKQISQACGASQRANKFYITGRGGHPQNSQDPLTSDVVWLDARAAKSQSVGSASSQTTNKLVAPAVGWVFDGKGKVTLIAAQTEGGSAGVRVICPNVGE